MSISFSDAACRQDPGMWDESSDDDPVREKPSERHQRHAVAARICRTQCPVLDACTAALLAQTEPAGGVWAGHLVMDPAAPWRTHEQKERLRRLARRAG